MRVRISILIMTVSEMVIIAKESDEQIALNKRRAKFNRNWAKLNKICKPNHSLLSFSQQVEKEVQNFKRRKLMA